MSDRLILFGRLAMYNTVALLTAAFVSDGAIPQHDDAGFDYRTELKPSGTIALDGRRLGDDKPFDLRVDANGLVAGTVAGSKVRIWISAAAHRRLAARLAGNPAARLAA